MAVEPRFTLSRRLSRYAALVLCAGWNCHAPRPDPGADSGLTPEKPAISQPLPYSREGIAAFTRAVHERCAESCAALMIEFSPEHTVAQLQAADRLGQLVQYEWSNGQLHGPTPIELRGKGNLAQNLFPLSSVDLSAIPTLVETARARVDRESGTLRRVLVRRNLPEDDSIGIRVFIDSPLRSGQVDADARGHLLTL